MSLASCMFVIDTEQYSGNFEREMCAFITGRTGGCEVGYEEASLASQDLNEEAVAWFEDHLESHSDDNGTSRPCSIWPTPGWLNDGMGGAYRTTDDLEEVRVRYLTEIRKYYGDQIQRAQARVDAGEKQWVPSLNNYIKTLAEAEERGPGQFPCYNSVAIFLDQEPPPDILNLMKARAALYEPDTIKVTGFRIITQKKRRPSKAGSR